MNKSKTNDYNVFWIRMSLRLINVRKFNSERSLKTQCHKVSVNKGQIFFRMINSKSRVMSERSLPLSEDTQ